MFKTNLTQVMMAFVCMFAVTAAYAQPIFTEDFEGSVGANGIPAGWTETGLSLDGIYAVGTSVQANASGYWPVPAHGKFAMTNDDVCGNVPANCNKSADRLILPVQDFSSITGGVQLTCDLYMDGLYGSSGAVEVSTNGGTTWTVVYVMPNATTWQDGSAINLSAYIGQSAVLIAFKYSDGGQWATGLAVDNVIIEPKPTHDLAIGLPSEDANGWTRTFIPVTGFKFMPANQIVKSELLFGATVSNRGTSTETNVYTRLNVARITAPNTFTNVYTDTIRLGSIAPDSLAWAVKDMTDSLWATPGNYRYEYIVIADSVDLKPASDTIRGFFTLTVDFWSKVDRATDGGPFGDNAYLPGVTAPNFVALQEWGTMYYMPKGANYVLDTMTVRLFSAASAAATSGTYQGRIYKITDGNASNSFDDILVDKTLMAIVADTIAITAGANYVRNLTEFKDVNTFATFMFEDDEIYYISVYQENTIAPGLNDGTVRNGFFVYGQTTNHDGFVYGNGANFQFYNPLITRENNAATPTAYEYGWSGGPEPSIFLNLSPFTGVEQVASAELAGVELFPNPTVKEFTVTLNLDAAADVRYLLTDINGRVIDIQYAKNASNESRTWDVTNFPAGVYFMHVKANGVTTTKRIVKK